MGLFKIISRSDALQNSLPTFFIESSCRKGHIALRRTTNGECCECSRLRSKRRYETHKEKAKEENRLWHQLNYEKRAIRQKAWKAANKDKVKQSNLHYLQSSLQYRIASSLRKRLNKIVGRKRGGSAIDNLGCSVEFFIKYIEEQLKPEMTWNNRGTVWHLDHKKPLMSFDLTKQSHIMIACHYTNIQPLLISEHKIKTIQDIRSMYNVAVP